MIVKKKKAVKLKRNLEMGKTPQHLETSSVDSNLKKNREVKKYISIDIEDYSNNYDEDSMKGLFFIVRGQFKHGLSPTVRFKGENGETNLDIGGYDPNAPLEEPWRKWYKVMDRVTFNSIYCGPYLDKALENITKCIVRCRTPKKYFREVCRVTSEDWYEVHYLKRRPLTSEESKTLASSGGRSPRVSPVMKEYYRAVYLVYGHYYDNLIGKAEEKAEARLKNMEQKSKVKKRKVRLRSL